MHTQTVLDFAVFQLTPTRTRCEFYAAAGEETEKLASGILKPFCLHLKALKELLAKGGHSIRLQPPLHSPQQSSWFTKGTLQRFIRFVSNPDVLERVATIEAELKQLEETVRMQTRNLSKTHAQHPRMNLPVSPLSKGARAMLGSCRKAFQKSEDSPGIDGCNIPGNSRKRLLHALEARRTVLQKEQGMSFARAAAAGFDDSHVKELILFSDCFGAKRLKEACLQFMNLRKSRQEISICAESMSTTNCVQSNSSLRTRVGPRISCKSHTSEKSGSSRVLNERFKGPHDAEWPCTQDKENENCTCFAVKGHSPNHSTEDQNSAAGNSWPCDEDLKIYTCGPQILPTTVAAEERCLSTGEDYKERASITLTELPCTSSCCNHCCCHDSLRGLQANHKVYTPVCVAPCKDTTSFQCLPESKYLSSYLSSQVASEEPLHDIKSHPSRYSPAYMKLCDRFTGQVNDSFDNEFLLSHCFNHNATMKKQVEHESSPSKKGGLAQAPRQLIYDQESVSKLVVVDNQIFSVSHSLDPSAEEDEEVGECCKDQSCGKELPNPKPSHLCVRDMVSSFERRTHDEPVLQDVCKRQESTHLQHLKQNIVERWSADSFLIGNECYKLNGDPKTRKAETLFRGGDRYLSSMTPSEVRSREWARSQSTLGTISSDDLKLFKFNDKEVGLMNPLYQEAFRAPSSTSFWMDSVGKLSASSIVKETTNELCSQQDSATDCPTQVAQSGGHTSLPDELMSSVSWPSEERVKRFLERYYEKREEKLRNRAYAEKEKAGFTSNSVQLFPDKEHAKPANNHEPEKLIRSSRGDSLAGKPRTYKESTPKSKKSKDEKGPEELHDCRQDQIRTSTSGECTTRKSPHSLKTPRLKSRLSSADLPAPRRSGLVSSKQKEAARLLSGSCNTGASKRARNPLSSSAPSLGKIDSKRVGTSSMRARTRSLTVVDNERVSQIKNRPCPTSTAATNIVDKKTVQLRKTSTRKVNSHALAPTEDKSKCTGKNAKGNSLLNITNVGAKEGPKNFLRKGTGSSRPVVRAGVLQPKLVKNKEVDTMYKGVSAIATPPVLSQTNVLAVGQQPQNAPAECLLAQQADAKGGTPSTTAAYPARTCSGEAKEESAQGVKRKGCDCTTSQQKERTLKSSSSELILPPDEHCVEVQGSSQSGGSHVGAAFLDGKLLLAPFYPAEPFFDPMQDDLISFTSDPFETGFAEAHASSIYQFGSGLSDVTRSTTNFQQPRMKGDASRIKSFVEQHVSTNNQSKDLKRFLKFGWRNTHTGLDQASTSIFSEEDEDRGSFSEPGPKILDCYGRKRNTTGKTRVSGFDIHHCSPSTPEHDEFKGHKTSKAINSENLVQELLPLFVLIH